MGTPAIPDPLQPLLALAGVAAATDEAQGAVDGVQWHRALRRHADRVRSELAVEDALALAALWERPTRTTREVDVDLAELRRLLRSGSEVPATLRAALRVTEEASAAAGAGQAGSPGWSVAPRQVLGRLHLAAAAGEVGDELLGRPRQDPDVLARLDVLLQTVALTKAPAVVVAAVVQGELLALDGFHGDGGSVARAASSVVLRARGADPAGVVPLAAGHLDLGVAAYADAHQGFVSGTPDGVARWLRYFASVIVTGSRRADEIASSVT